MDATGGVVSVKKVPFRESADERAVVKYVPSTVQAPAACTPEDELRSPRNLTAFHIQAYLVMLRSLAVKYL